MFSESCDLFNHLPFLSQTHHTFQLVPLHPPYNAHPLLHQKAPRADREPMSDTPNSYTHPPPHVDALDIPECHNGNGEIVEQGELGSLNQESAWLRRVEERWRDGVEEELPRRMEIVTREAEGAAVRGPVTENLFCQ